MKNHYHQVAVASVCTALGFILGTEEAYSAKFDFYFPRTTFHVIDGGSYGSFDGLGDRMTNVAYNLDVESGNPHSWDTVERTAVSETAALVEFYLGLDIPIFGFSSGTRMTNVTNAVLRVELLSAPTADSGSEPRDLGIFGYVGNGIAEASDFEAGVFLDSTDISESGRQFAYFNVTSFINERVSNNNEFAGFALRSLKQNSIILGTGFGAVPPTLTVEADIAAEPVPEPTTIFGSAIALGLGGWLKRKKSSPQHKTTSQH